MSNDNVVDLPTRDKVPEPPITTKIPDSLTMYEDILVTANPETGCIYTYQLHETHMEQINMFQITRESIVDHVGCDLALSKDYLLVGAPADSSNGKDAGIVYLFKRVNDMYALVTTIEPPSVDNSGLFGASVAICGDYIAIGAPAEISDSNTIGVVHIYKLMLEHTSGRKTPTHIDSYKGVASGMGQFGQAVALTATELMVSAHAIDLKNQPGSGVVCVIDYINHVQGTDVKFTQVIKSGSDDGPYFGYNLAALNDILVIADPRVFEDEHTGHVSIYKSDGSNYSQVGDITPGEQDVEDRFGYAIAYGSKFIVVGCMRINMRVMESYTSIHTIKE